MKLQSLDGLYKNDPEWGLTQNYDFEFRGYNGLMKSAGLQIFWQEDVGSYQGTTYSILYDPDTDKWGFKSNGFGSCSFCDSWQSCNSVADAESLRDSLVNGIMWQDSKADLAEWLKNHDWEGNWYYSEVRDNGILDKMLNALQ